MADEVLGGAVESSKAAFDLSLQTGLYGGWSVAIKIDSAWLAAGLGLMSLGAFYIYRKYPSQNAIRNGLEGNENGQVDPEVTGIEQGSILVDLVCRTEKSFLSFVNDFETNRTKLRLEEEFRKIGFSGELEVTIINLKEVYEKVDHIR